MSGDGRRRESAAAEAETLGASDIAAGLDPPQGKRRPRLRTILLVTYVLVLAIPLGSVSLLRLYDSMLIRQTESELIVQGAALAALYRAELSRSQEERVPEPAAPTDGPGEPFRPAIASLDLARHPVLDPMPPARLPNQPPDPVAVEAGRRLEPILVEIQRTSLAGLRLLDPAGTVVATSGSESGMNLSHRSEAGAALAGLRSSVLRRRDLRGDTPPLGSISRGTGLRVVVGFPITARDAEGERVLGAVMLARTPMSVRQAIYRDRRYFLTGGVVTVVAITLLAWLTGAALGRPLRDLIDQTERVRRGEKEAAVPLPKPVTREVEQISHAVAEMARTLVERADYIAAFAANVSHEFKTPLTSIHGTVELLRDHLHEMTADEQRRFLEILEKDAARLERLVERLLELARADVVRAGDARCQLGPMLDSVAARHESLGLNLKIEAAADRLAQVELAIGAEALDSILANLLDNARQHAGEHVAVTLNAERSNRRDKIRLQVIDDGPGISEANQERVFDRFFTTRRAEGGSGLGLAIVRALARAHGGEIHLRSRPGETVFEIELPIAKVSTGLVA